MKVLCSQWQAPGYIGLHYPSSSRTARLHCDHRRSAHHHHLFHFLPCSRRLSRRLALQAAQRRIESRRFCHAYHHAVVLAGRESGGRNHHVIGTYRQRCHCKVSASIREHRPRRGRTSRLPDFHLCFRNWHALGVEHRSTNCAGRATLSVSTETKRDHRHKDPEEREASATHTHHLHD